MKVMLVFSPHWTAAMPHLALPTLAAYLRPRGVDVILRDLNLETFEAILTRDFIEQSLVRVREEYGPRGDRRSYRDGGPQRDRIAWALERGPWLASQVDQALGVIRSEAFLDGPTGVRAFEVIAEALDVASLPFHPSSFGLTSFVPPAPVDNSRLLLAAVRDAARNIYFDIFRRVILPDIVRAEPDIVGISIPTESQMLAGMTLAHLIKQSGLACHITVGGPHISMLREQLPRVPVLSKLIDSAVLFEGEAPLLRLAEMLDAHGDLAQVPNLIWWDGKQCRVNDAAPQAVGLSGGAADDAVSMWLKPFPEDAIPLQAAAVDPQPGPRDGADDTLPEGLPDFGGLPLDRYLSPYLVLPLLTAHGCYHGDCAFCNVGYGREGHFKPLRSALVVEQMLALQRKYGIRHIFFADEAMTPHSMREMSALLTAHERDGGTPIHWCGCMRFERSITPDLLNAMSGAGCRMIMFGLETASERMIEHMVKGTQLKHMSRLLKESAAAGIWNHTFFFFGFPTETMADAQDTVNFVYAHGDVIHSASPGAFVLERYSPAHLRPHDFGVRRVIEQPERDLAIYFDFELESGLDERAAQNLVDRLVEVLPTKRYGQYYAQDTYRLLYAGRLHELGQPFPGWLSEEPVET